MEFSSTRTVSSTGGALLDIRPCRLARPGKSDLRQRRLGRLHGGRARRLDARNFIGTTTSGNRAAAELDAACVERRDEPSSATSADHRIGGTSPGDGNRIAFNQRDGVSLVA
ncbi:MAG: hypothetical protein R3F11_01595 [Verrucomicrobiales bacterium]